MRRKPLFQEGLLPLLKRHLVHANRDPVPQRLYILDLFVDGQGVKPWRRQGQRMWHVPDYTTRAGAVSTGVPQKIGGRISSAQRLRVPRRRKCDYIVHASLSQLRQNLFDRKRKPAFGTFVRIQAEAFDDFVAQLLMVAVGRIATTGTVSKDIAEFPGQA